MKAQGTWTVSSGLPTAGSISRNLTHELTLLGFLLIMEFYHIINALHSLLEIIALLNQL